MNLLTWHAPWYLLAIPPILVALWWWSRQPGLPPPRRQIVLVTRMVSVPLLVLALAGPPWQIPPRAGTPAPVRDKTSA